VTPNFVINIILQDTKLASHKISGLLFLDVLRVWSDVKREVWMLRC